MNLKLQKVKLFELDGKDVWLFRLPNETGDYIDISSYGCRLAGLNVHMPDGKYENLLRAGFKSDKASMDEAPCYSLLSGTIGESLVNTAWDVIGEGDDFIMLSAETPSEVKIGVKITWLKLNRLVLDIFATPKNDCEVSIVSQIALADKTFEISTFCREVAGVNAADTPYADMAFVPFEGSCGPFTDSSQEIKPMIELKETDKPLRISCYTTLKNTSVESEMNCRTVKHFNAAPEKLLAGETLTERVIYGIDYITVSLLSDEKDPESPFEGLLLGGL